MRAVGEGIDMFDTCIPTRFGRHGTALTHNGRNDHFKCGVHQGMSALWMKNAIVQFAKDIPVLISGI